MTIYIDQAFANHENRSILGHIKLPWFANEIQKILEKKIDGDVAECGVYRGGSARLLSTVFPNKKIYLFDSFEGMIEDDLIDEGHKKGDFKERESSLEEVQRYLSDKPNCLFYKGWIPSSTSFLTNETFSLVHLDLDLYQSTKSAIEVFWPRLVIGGSMIFDDVNWPNCPGVDKCLIECFSNIPHKRIDGPNMSLIEKIETL
jgi:O-methyltransferase